MNEKNGRLKVWREKMSGDFQSSSYYLVSKQNSTQTCNGTENFRKMSTCLEITIDPTVFEEFNIL